MNRTVNNGGAVPTGRKPDPVAPVKAGIWLYAWLLVIEGILRKWVLPQYSDVLFVIRDPVVLMIYFLALRAQLFPFRPAVAALGVMAALSIAFALQQETTHLIVAFGLRTNYLHLPLVFVMEAALDRRDVVRFGRWFMVLSVPILLLMIVQFNAAPRDWVNIGVGGAEGAQLRGAIGKIRPPGPFSFITGIVQWFGLAAAFVAHGWLVRGVYHRLLLVVATLTVIVAVPISISRSLLLEILIVALFAGATLLGNPRKSQRLLGPVVAALGLAAVTVHTVYVRAFVTRWNEAIEAGSGGFYSHVVLRFFGAFAEPFLVAGDAPLLGHGIGMGTVAGARLMSGKYEFLLAESEMGRVILELGPFLGFAFIGWRLWLVLVMLKRSWLQVLQQQSPLPWLLTGACFLNVLMGQWGPATLLGLAVFGAGLVLAALREPEAEAA